MSLPPPSAQFDYEVVDGIFDLPAPHLTAEELPLPRFGLRDGSWSQFEERLAELQRQCKDGESIKVIYVGRHGQGDHNLAHLKHGAEAFYNKYARMEKDEDGLQIGPDPQLTDLGRQQAARVAASWKSEAQDGMPGLQAIYVSPLRRAGETCVISIEHPDKRPLVVEHLREGINTMHEKEHGLPFDKSFEISPGLYFTDNARSSKSKIAELFPRFDFEEGFAEEDPMWTPTAHENGQQHIARTRSVLDRIFTHDKSTYIGLFAHGGTQLTTLATLGLPKRVPPVCGASSLPMHA